jgi:heme exporter protein D
LGVEKCHQARAWIARKEFAMGIWLELGIFVLVLIFGIWQIRDAKRAHAKSVADRKAREAKQLDQG